MNAWNISKPHNILSHKPVITNINISIIRFEMYNYFLCTQIVQIVNLSRFIVYRFIVALVTTGIDDSHNNTAKFFSHGNVTCLINIDSIAVLSVVKANSKIKLPNSGTMSLPTNNFWEKQAQFLDPLNIIE